MKLKIIFFNFKFKPFSLDKHACLSGICSLIPDIFNLEHLLPLPFDVVVSDLLTSCGVALTQQFSLIDEPEFQIRVLDLEPPGSILLLLDSPLHIVDKEVEG